MINRSKRWSVSTALLAVAIAANAAAPAQPTSDVADDVFYHFMPIAWRDSDNDTYRFGDMIGKRHNVVIRFCLIFPRLGVCPMKNPALPRAGFSRSTRSLYVALGRCRLHYWQTWLRDS